MKSAESRQSWGGKSMVGGKCHDCTELLFQEITSIALEEFGVLEGVRGAKEPTSGGSP